MPGKEHGEVQNHADHGRRDAGERCGELELPVGGLHHRPAEQNKNKTRQKSKKRRHGGRSRAGEKQGIGAEQLFGPAADKPDKGDNHDQRARRGFTECQAVDHLSGGEPLKFADCGLIHIRQHRVRAAEGEQCRLGEKPAHLREHTVAATGVNQQGHCHGPDQHADDQHADEAAPSEPRVFRRRRGVVDNRRTVTFCLAAVSAAGGEFIRRHTATDVADDAGGNHDQGERQFQRKNRHECRRSHGPQHAVFQSARADAVRCEHHHCRHRRFNAIEQTRHHRQVAVCHVNPRQPNQNKERGQHKQAARHDAAPGAMHQPADVDRELLCFRARQHPAVIERVQKTLIGNPAFTLDQILMHDRDLPSRAAKADEAEFEPIPEGFGETHGGWCAVID